MAGRVEEKQLSSCRKYEQRHGDRKLQTVLSTYSSLGGEEVARADAVGLRPKLWPGGRLGGPCTLSRGGIWRPIEGF